MSTADSSPIPADAAPADRPLVRVSHVSKFYGDFQALDDVSLDIHRGEVVAVIGASGSGKSTLCRTINRLETIQEGTIEIDGELLPEEGRELTRLRAEVGMVFQSFNLFPHRTVLDNITLAPVRVRGIARSEAETTARTLLERVGLGGAGRKRAGSFSTGMKVRLALAMALLTDPEVLILDEPQNGLDPQGIIELRDLLRGLADAGRTVVVSSHQLGEMARMADDVGVLVAGRLAYEGPLSGLAHPDDGPGLEAAYLDLVTGRGAGAR